MMMLFYKKLPEAVQDFPPTVQFGPKQRNTFNSIYKFSWKEFVKMKQMHQKYHATANCDDRDKYELWSNMNRLWI